ncbi:hypothetical protein F4802DRAFT_599280 [Xylaria palmicola]|nr:hypothetical protein F4802DRAFT_599280 [Xylaria palmicola]
MSATNLSMSKKDYHATISHSHPTSMTSIKIPALYQMFTSPVSCIEHVISTRYSTLLYKVSFKLNLLLRRRLRSQQSHAESSTNRSRPPLQWPHQASSRNRSSATPTSDGQEIDKWRSTDDPNSRALEALHISARYHDRGGKGHRRASPAASSRHHGSGVSKRHERPRNTASRSQTKDRAGNVKAHAVTSLLSSTESVSDSLCEQDTSITASSLLSDCMANDEAEAQVPVVRDDDYDDDEDDDEGVYRQVSRTPSSYASAHLDTEFQENLRAVPADSRHLYLEYYERTRGGGEAEAANNDDYWTWDPLKGRWFHVDEVTKSVVWFMG